MAQTIKLRRSATSGAQPTTSQIELGELALNTYDGKVYMKKSVGGTESIVEVTGGSGSSAGGALYTDEFSGDGSTTGFTLSVAPVSEDDLIVFIDGVYQNLNSYSISSTTLTFDTAPDNGTTVIVHHFQGGILGTAPVIDTMTGDGSDTTLTLSIAPSSENQTFVTFDGVVQHKSTYSVSGTTLTFSEAVPNGVTVECVTFRNVQVATFEDADGDTKIQVEETADEDIIRFDVAGTEVLQLTSDGLVLSSTDVEANEFIGDLRGAVLFKAQAGENVTKGDVVYISGISGNTTVVSKADADDASKMPAFGIVAATTTSGQPVDIYTQGILGDLDTSSYSEGDELFVSTTAGALTDTAPTGESSKLQKIAKVTRSNATSGSIFITGAGRSNAVPNLDDGDIFIGNASNQAVTASLDTEIESYLDGGTSTPTFASATVTGDLTVDTSTLKVDSSNNRVGIGTASPEIALHVDISDSTVYSSSFTGSSTYTPSQTPNALQLRNTNSAQAGNNVGLWFETTGAGNTGNERAGRIVFVNNSSVNYGGDFAFQLRGSGASMAERMRIAASGNVGIGTTSPSEKLDVVNGGLGVGNGTIKTVISYNTRAVFGTTSNHDLEIRTNNTERMRLMTQGSLLIGKTVVDNTTDGIRLDGTNNFVSFVRDGGEPLLLNRKTSDGALITFRKDGSDVGVIGTQNWGIGETNPANDNRLHVKYSDTGATPFSTSPLVVERAGVNLINILGQNADDTGFLFGDQDDNDVGGLFYLHGSNAMTFRTNTSERLRIASDGSIGINTSSPISLGGHDGVVTLYGSNATALILQNSTSSSRLAQLGSDLGFFVATYETERMRLTSTGLGIGTNSPAQKLHVVDTSNPTSPNGSVVIEGQRDGTANLLELRARDASASSSALPANQGGIIRMNGFDGTDFEEMAFIGYQAEATVADGDAPSRLIFGTTSDGAGLTTEKMRLTSAGNVGIGTTDPRHKLSVNGTLGSSTFSGFGMGVIGGLATAESGNTNRAIGIQATSSTNSKLFSYDYGASAGIPISIQPDNANVYICVGGGNVGIGTDDPLSMLELDRSTNGFNELRLTNGRYNTSGIGFAISARGYQNVEVGRIEFLRTAAWNESNSTKDSDMVFSTALNGTSNERMRLDAGGRLTVGNSSALSLGVIGSKFNGSTQNGIVVETTRDATGSTFIRFNDSDSAAIGSIYQDGASSVTYATTSDYRLKENIIYDWSALDRLNQLKPAQFNFIGDNRTINGFIAHEVENIVPEAIVGKKDAVNEDGSIKPQNIDKSRLVPLLVKAVQEQQEQIESLKREIGILKGEIND